MDQAEQPPLSWVPCHLDLSSQTQRADFAKMKGHKKVLAISCSDTLTHHSHSTSFTKIIKKKALLRNNSIPSADIFAKIEHPHHVNLIWNRPKICATDIASTCHILQQTFTILYVLITSSRRFYSSGCITGDLYQ